MAKTYVTNTKYEIISRFKVDGVVDKHDVIGAIFGQSEGLLGEDMELRELQKNGKIGRIEINLSSKDGKTEGEVKIPSSMDMAETCTLAATIETVDKVGPCDSKFETIQIQDKRASKRQEIVNRAQNLLQKFVKEEIPETTEITEKVREKAKTSNLVEWGKSRIPAGPEVTKSDSIIIVEGRADVLALLKNNIKNVISMNGANPPLELSKLMQNKTVTVFIDGDRGGELNLRKLMAIGKVDFVARAPEGKEVEELQRKEIIASLKHKIPIKTFLEERRLKHVPVKKSFRYHREKIATIKKWQKNPFKKTRHLKAVPARKPLFLEEKKQFKKDMEELNGSLKARILDENKKVLKEVPVRELLKEIPKTKNANAIVMDGIITERLAKTSEKQGIKTIVGIRQGNIKEKPKNLKIVSYSN